MEHRWGHRREIIRPVRLETRGGVVTRGRTANVSISGAFIFAGIPIPLYSYLNVEFTVMKGGSRTTTATEGQVVRRDANGFGIEWCEFAPDCVRALVMGPPFRNAPSSPADWEPTRRHRLKA